MWLNMTVKQKIKRWLILWIIDDWINTNVLFWFLKACIIKRDFSKAFSMFKCFISFTNRELKMQISIDTSLLLTDSKISFSSSSTIFFARDAMNEKLMMILIIKCIYAIDAKNFLDRSRSRFSSSASVCTFESAVIWFDWCKNSMLKWVFDWFDNKLFYWFDDKSLFETFSFW